MKLPIQFGDLSGRLARALGVRGPTPYDVPKELAFSAKLIDLTAPPVVLEPHYCLAGIYSDGSASAFTALWLRNPPGSRRWIAVTGGQVFTKSTTDQYSLVVGRSLDWDVEPFAASANVGVMNDGSNGSSNSPALPTGQVDPTPRPGAVGVELGLFTGSNAIPAAGITLYPGDALQIITALAGSAITLRGWISWQEWAVL